WVWCGSWLFFFRGGVRGGGAPACVTRWVGPARGRSRGRNCRLASRPSRRRARERRRGLVKDGALLRVEQLTCDFGALRAVNRVSLGVKAGTLHSVIGPNGSGKTTLFNLVSGQILPTDGRVYFEGRDVTGLPSHRLPHLGLARCFQRTNVFPKLTAYENVWVAAFARRTPGALGFLRRAAEFAEVDLEARRILGEVGLAHKLAAR